MSKKITEDVSQPTFKTPGARSQTSLSTRTSKSDQSPRGRGSSSVSSSVPASGSSSGNSYNKDSWKSSVSSRSSLSSLRDFLPENPHVYNFKEIFTATKGFLSPKYSSSSSSSAWRCVIRGDDVIVFQRKCKRPIDETELRERLLVICKSHHSSLIKLRGASISGSYIYLVYDLNMLVIPKRSVSWSRFLQISKMAENEESVSYSLENVSEEATHINKASANGSGNSCCNFAVKTAMIWLSKELLCDLAIKRAVVCPKLSNNVDGLWCSGGDASSEAMASQKRNREVKHMMFEF
ncbi:hypothetical protein E3N88_38217 [Mikania micrantha]|uniref:Uncharacterized protein n=1 Tax=Mikania micrantha TaxID=192012 RepID=A0A5N6LTM0_9ASTR|nr:hypothetical protein E3N88_38217 [Mikania micrantha]